MRVTHLPLVFEKALPIIGSLESVGYEAYFVGGSVRDFLLGTPIHDVDIATSAYPEEVKEIFKRTVDVGIEHGTILVLSGDDSYEVTTFRTESTYQDFRRPDQVTFVRSLEEDLKRRDFTINALAMNKEGGVTDLFFGERDIKDKVIRAVGDASERFHEDALRMMRALRLASQLDFEIAPDTLKAIYSHHELLQKISIERIQVEYVKLMLGKNRPKGLIPFIESNAYKQCPDFSTKAEELYDLSRIIPKQIASEDLVWLLTCHFLLATPKEVPAFITKWKTSKKILKKTQIGLSALRLRLSQPWTIEDIFDLGLEQVLLVEEAVELIGQKADKKSVEQLFSAMPIQSPQDLAVNGGDLIKVCQEKPGPWLGSSLKELEKLVLRGHLTNDKASLLAFVQRKRGE